MPGKRKDQSGVIDSPEGSVAIDKRQDGPSSGHASSGHASSRSGAPSIDPDHHESPPPSNVFSRPRTMRRNIAPIYGAIDLGTNNCRLLIAYPTRHNFRVIDSFSRTVYLGEGMSQSTLIREQAIIRSIEALKICASKMSVRGVQRFQGIATAVCRMAENRDWFLKRVQDQVGLRLEVITPETEVRLAVSGCASLLHGDYDMALVFDIGGGSSELALVEISRSRTLCPLTVQTSILAWTSLPIGVATLKERFDHMPSSRETFEKMVSFVRNLLQPFERAYDISGRLKKGRAYFLGTSGTVTTIASLHLELPYYNRREVDGCWLETAHASKITDRLIDMSPECRVANPCIGIERSELLLAGCAIWEAIQRQWPCTWLQVADRGLREGILTTMMARDGMFYRARH